MDYELVECSRQELQSENRLRAPIERKGLLQIRTVRGPEKGRCETEPFKTHISTVEVVRKICLEKP
jgi:hypothetical protein